MRRWKLLATVRPDALRLDNENGAWVRLDDAEAEIAKAVAQRDQVTLDRDRWRKECMALRREMARILGMAQHALEEDG